MGLYIVSGATGKYGSIITDALRGAGHEVQEAQRTASRRDTSSVEFWNDCDFGSPADAMSIVQVMLTEHMVADGVVFAHAVRSTNPTDPFEVADCVMGNAIAPIMATYYMHRFGVLKKNARIIFLLDKRERITDISYAMSKDALLPMAERLLGAAKETKLIYAALPDVDDVAAQSVGTRITELLTAAKLPSKKVVNLKA
jgi:hypothetical protein